MSKKAEILWLDLEMTGLSPDTDLILEVAAIATDWNFKEIANYETAITHSIDDIKTKMSQNGDFWDKNPESRDGLLKSNANGKSLSRAEKELIEFIKSNFKTKPVILAGNSIHMDRRFIEKQMRSLDTLLHYRMLDVSAWKLVFENRLGKRFLKPENHRALDDIRGSIEEMAYYMGYIK